MPLTIRMPLTATESGLPILIGVIAVALPSVWLLRRRKPIQNDDAADLPVAPAGIFECVREISGANAFSFVKDMADATGSFIYRLRLPVFGGTVIVGDPFVQREILLDIDSEKPYLYSYFARIGGYPNIFTRKSADPIWKAARKGSAPAFSSREISRMNYVCLVHLQKWIETTVDQNIGFDVSECMIRLTFFIVMESAFEYRPTEEEYTSFVENLEVALREFLFRHSVNPLRQLFGCLIPETRRAVQACLRCRIFAQHLLNAYRLNPNKSPQNTLIKMIEENPAFEGNDKMKISELITYMVAGFDTTGYTLSSTLILLAQHPEAVKKARDSIDINCQMTDTIRYILAESSRLYPVAAMGSIRFIPRDIAVFDKKSQRKYLIPKGSICFMPQYLANRNPAVFGDDANEFRPERWESASQEMNDARLMFSLGNRNCIGQSLALAELHSVLPRLIKDYNFELIEPGHLDYFLTLKFHGAKIKLSKVAM